MTGTTSFVDVKHVMAASLTGVRTQPTNNIVTINASYEVLFTTATTGTIKNITMAFPAGYSLLSAILIERNGIGAGSLSASGTTLTYTVAPPSVVRVPAGTAIRLEVANITQPNTAGSHSITITTKDTRGNMIDGPTASTTSLTQIGSAAIANGAITGPKIASDAIIVYKADGDLVSLTIPPHSAKGGNSYCPGGYIPMGVSILSNSPAVHVTVNEDGGLHWELVAQNTDQIHSQGLQFYAECILILANPNGTSLGK